MSKPKEWYLVNQTESLSLKDANHSLVNHTKLEIYQLAYPKLQFAQFFIKEKQPIGRNERGSEEQGKENESNFIEIN